MRLVVLTVLALLAGTATAGAAGTTTAAAAGAWRWPVHGEVLTPFHLTASPFARGQHRGIDIAARPGARVRSACAGEVRFAGRLPGRGRGITVACGHLLATYLELATTTAAPGDRVDRGQPIGTVAASHLQLGARRAGWPFGYLDPLTLLETPRPPPIGAAPRGRPKPPHAAPAPPQRRVAAERRAVDRPARTPLAAWLGLALLAAGAPLGALAHRRRHRSTATAPSLRPLP